jgi:NhaP-type Na+/H+ or K+/H+ antiporter
MGGFGVVGAVIGALIGWLLSTLPQEDLFLQEDLRAAIISFGLVNGLAIGLGLGAIMGGSDTVVKHYVLRLFLQRSGSIPRRYARFLDYCAERILLRKVGGGYIFIHRYLLEYFASLEKPSS